MSAVERSKCDVDEKGVKVNYCRQALGDAIGCPTEALDEYGYCPHLMGFTNDQKPPYIMERIEPLERADGNGAMFDTGSKRVTLKKREAVKDSDVIFNPEYEQIVNGIKYQVKKWASARVYRADAYKVPHSRTPEPSPNDKAANKLDAILDAVINLGERVQKLEGKKNPQKKAKKAQIDRDRGDAATDEGIQSDQ